MFDSINIFKKIEDLIKEHGSTSILRDHIALVRERLFSKAEDDLSSLPSVKCFTSREIPKYS